MFHVEQKAATPEYLFGRKVAEVRKNLGLSQRDLAALLVEKGMKVDASAVSRLESGDRALPLSEVYAVADVLGVPAKNLVPHMTNPKAELEMIRKAADLAWVRMGTNAASLAGHMLEIVDRLTENPDYLSGFVTPDGRGVDSPRDYFEWVVQQSQDALDRRFNAGEFSVDDFAWVETAETKEYLLDVLKRLMGPFLVAATHPDLREDAAWRQGPPEELNGEHSEAS